MSTTYLLLLAIAIHFLGVTIALCMFFYAHFVHLDKEDTTERLRRIRFWRSLALCSFGWLALVLVLGSYLVFDRFGWDPFGVTVGEGKEGKA